MAPRIQFRRGTAAAWTSADPVLAAGEFGYETDTDQFKIGDGTTAWSALSYFSAGSGLTKGVAVNVLYISANTRWEYRDGTLPDFTALRAAGVSIYWHGTTAQIPVEGVAVAEFQVGDIAMIRSSTL